jgi:hypothetical protein
VTDKYFSLDLGELLSLLVTHQIRLNELLTNKQYGSRKYLRQRDSIRQIQRAIKAITDTGAIT